MEVEEIEYHALHSVDHCFAEEMVVGLGQTADDVLKVDGADFLLLRGKSHYRIFEE